MTCLVTNFLCILLIDTNENPFLYLSSFICLKFTLETKNVIYVKIIKMLFLRK